jgi:XTP/dITP diphosphohydrolase
MIAEQPKGDHGFGYDSIFIPKDPGGQGGQIDPIDPIEMTRTLAEMSEDEKNKISHRALALKALVLQVQSRGITLAKP